MKKIAALIVMAALFAGTISAADVSWSGWFSTDGSMTTTNQKGMDSDAKKPMFKMGDSDFSYTITVSGDNFGATSTVGAVTNPGKMAFDTPKLNKSRIWNKFNDMFTLHAGIKMEFLDYNITSTAHGSSVVLTEEFGKDLGKFNWTGDNWAGDNTGYGQTSGVVGELSLDALSAAVLFRSFDGEVKAEKALEKNVIAMAKYSLDVATIYAGFGAQPAKAGNDIWVSVATSVVPGLTANAKFETNMAKESEDVNNFIGLSLGYDMAAVGINTDTSINLMDDKGVDGAETMNWMFELQATPKNIPLVNLEVDFIVKGGNADEATIDYGFGGAITKSFGNVTNKLIFGYMNETADVKDAEAKTTTTVKYALTMWF